MALIAVTEALEAKLIYVQNFRSSCSESYISRFGTRGFNSSRLLKGIYRELDSYFNSDIAFRNSAFVVATKVVANPLHIIQELFLSRKRRGGDVDCFRNADSNVSSGIDWILW
jgi:hypothetical protein